MQGYSTVASRYAESLLHLAKEQDLTDAVNTDMAALQQTHAESADFRSVLKSPVIPVKVKAAALEKAFEGKLNKLTLLFIKKLTDARRESYLGEIAAAYIAKYRTLKGILTVDIKTAMPLTSVLRQEIMNLVKSTPEYAKASRIELEEKVDPSLIGGIVITVADRQVDASFSRKIREFRRAFKENPYVIDF